MVCAVTGYAGLPKMRKNKKTVRIGVCGIHAKAGATHVSHMLALYLAGCKRRKTAVLEGDGKASFRLLEQYLFGRNCGEESFRMRRCIYRYDALEEGTEAADYIVCDAGSGSLCRFDMLFSCDRYIAVGSGGVFCRGEWEDFLGAREVSEHIYLRGMKDWRYLKNHARSGREEILTLRVNGEKQKIKVYGLGAEENLLHLSKEAQKLMEKMDI